MNYLASMQKQQVNVNEINQQQLHSESYSSCSSYTSDESDLDFSILDLASKMDDMDETILLDKHGYKFCNKEIISETLQGEIFLATKYESDTLVAIKKISKKLSDKKECIQDGFTFITDKNIVNEGLILQFINEKRDDNNKCIIKYEDFFESDDYYYLVEEYIPNSMTLKEFVIKGHEFIKTKKISARRYRKSITQIIEQLSMALDSLHNFYKCTHLDICPENIVLINAEFFQNSDGSITINPNIIPKLIDFGNSKKYENNDKIFECNKQFLSLENEQYLCPEMTQTDMEVDNYYYDAKACDMWSFGMTVYYCYIGQYPFEIMEITKDGSLKKGSGFWCVLNGKLKQILCMDGKLKYINSKILSLMNGLLKVNPELRLTAHNVSTHQLFRRR